MKTVILAGGFGSRLSEYTEKIPKPMVTVGDKPILLHIMHTYAHFGHKDFLIALGYKSEIIKEYFLNFSNINSDFTVDLKSGSVVTKESNKLDWMVTLIDTGLHSMTGGRLKRMERYIEHEPFLLTYGDGLSDINITDLVDFHKSHGRLVTVSAVRPNARFGRIELDGDCVTSFEEKPQISEGWVNGGYFVMQPEFLELLDGDTTILEREPLEKAAQMGELMAYRHDGFWQCMDTKRDRDLLERLWASHNSPWIRN